LFAFNFPVFLIVVLFPTQILSIFGKSFAQGASALVLLSWASVVDAGTGMCGAILDMTGFTKLKLMNAILRLATVLVVSIILIPRQGMVGAAIAALCGEILVNLLRLGEVYFLFRLLPYSLGFLKPVFAGLAALAFTLLVSTWLGLAAKGIEVVFQMALLAIVYVALILLLGLDAEDRAILARLKRRATRKFNQFQNKSERLEP
jgi:O-antigen/teichoic acid export membrane protein